MIFLQNVWKRMIFQPWLTDSACARWMFPHRLSSWRVWVRRWAPAEAPDSRPSSIPNRENNWAFTLQTLVCSAISGPANRTLDIAKCYIKSWVACEASPKQPRTNPLTFPIEASLFYTGPLTPSGVPGVAPLAAPQQGWWRQVSLLAGDSSSLQSPLPELPPPPPPPELPPPQRPPLLTFRSVELKGHHVRPQGGPSGSSAHPQGRGTVLGRGGRHGSGLVEEGWWRIEQSWGPVGVYPPGPESHH